jgi:hypothetical protein
VAKYYEGGVFERGRSSLDLSSNEIIYIDTDNKIIDVGYHVLPCDPSSPLIIQSAGISSCLRMRCGHDCNYCALSLAIELFLQSKKGPSDT